jgi:hypothetical protein
MRALNMTGRYGSDDISKDELFLPETNLCCLRPPVPGMRQNTNVCIEDLDQELAVLFGIEDPAQPPAPAVEDRTAIGMAPGRRRFITFERVVSVLLALGILACLGGFFLFVPAIPAITVGLMLSGLLAMFWLGFHAGGRRHLGC